LKKQLRLKIGGIAAVGDEVRITAQSSLPSITSAAWE
jgi:hypothetical protein